ncbi:MAG TPA: LemA family protein [Chryseolinea sp.]|nr:LemA family protein [Chryseolinea sp.]HPH46820.1 LemA family protein [Chryseolinea sp.]HPM29703.1 LemA family protein [Chryseolinea sp.]
MIPTIITIVVILALVFFFISIYNRLAKSKVLTEEGWSGIGTFLQQRNDLIPNLVEVVKGFAGHENKTLTDVIKARNESISALTPEAQIEAAKHVSQAMLNLKVLTEQYPQLQANQNFLQLQSELGSIEEKINQSRRYYNGTVREFNQLRVVFPNILIANSLGFKAALFFQEDETAKTAPQIKF